MIIHWLPHCGVCMPLCYETTCRFVLVHLKQLLHIIREVVKVGGLTATIIDAKNGLGLGLFFGLAGLVKLDKVHDTLLRFVGLGLIHVLEPWQLRPFQRWEGRGLLTPKELPRGSGGQELVWVLLAPVLQPLEAGSEGVLDLLVHGSTAFPVHVAVGVDRGAEEEVVAPGLREFRHHDGGDELLNAHPRHVGGSPGGGDALGPAAHLLADDGEVQEVVAVQQHLEAVVGADGRQGDDGGPEPGGQADKLGLRGPDQLVLLPLAFVGLTDPAWE
mmetsp:Transcript_111995/g.194463  ORF Transcript_111995/g.194463 Transcript_111995/m.194463 type:complete len:273 (-) Transcript_111995:1951-2769(-)